MAKLKKYTKKFYKELYSGECPGVIQGICTGYKDFDYAVGGMRPGELIMISGRPAMGKTSLALNIVSNVSKKGSAKTLYLTNDCSEKVLCDRLIQVHANVRGISVARRDFYDEEMDLLIQEEKNLKRSNVEIQNITGISIAGIERIVNQSNCKGKLDLVVVDGFEMLKEADNSQDTEILRKLKCIAEEIQAPIIITSKVGRSAECREDHRPKLFDVSIKDYAVLCDTVIFMYNEDYYNQEKKIEYKYTDTSVMELDIVKNPRHCRGSVMLKVYQDCFSMVNMDTAGEQIQSTNEYQEHFNESI